MSQEVLDLLQRHAAVQERLRHRMSEEVRIHPLSDLGLGHRLFHNPLDAARRVALIVRRLKEMTGAAGAQVGVELLGQLGQDRHVAALAAFSLGKQDHLLVRDKNPRPCKREDAAHFFGDIARLVIGEVVLTPELRRGRDMVFRPEVDVAFGDGARISGPF
jgi:hypothetical protein